MLSSQDSPVWALLQQLPGCGLRIGLRAACRRAHAWIAVVLTVCSLPSYEYSSKWYETILRTIGPGHTELADTTTADHHLDACFSAVEPCVQLGSENEFKLADYPEAAFAQCSRCY